MAQTQTYTTRLETTTCWCGVPVALPENLLRNARDNGTRLYCPATGHQFHFDPEIDKIRKQLESAKARNTALRDQLDAAERRVSATKGQLTKARRRAQAGVCPCCKRSFVQLTRHMANKHPNFDPKAE